MRSVPPATTASDGSPASASSASGSRLGTRVGTPRGCRTAAKPSQPPCYLPVNGHATGRSLGRIVRNRSLRGLVRGGTAIGPSGQRDDCYVRNTARRPDGGSSRWEGLAGDERLRGPDRGRPCVVGGAMGTFVTLRRLAAGAVAATTLAISAATGAGASPASPSSADARGQTAVQNY